MLRDLLIGTVSSLIASGLIWLLGQKATKKYNSIILKIYVLFLTGIVFITVELSAFALSNSIMKKIMTPHDIERLYRFFSHDLVFIIVLFASVTAIVILVESFHRSDILEKE